MAQEPETTTGCQELDKPLHGPERQLCIPFIRVLFANTVTVVTVYRAWANIWWGRPLAAATADPACFIGQHIKPLLTCGHVGRKLPVIYVALQCDSQKPALFAP